MDYESKLVSTSYRIVFSKLNMLLIITSTTTTTTLSWTPWVSRYEKGKTRKVKTNLGLVEQVTVTGSGISWAICKSAPHPRQITIPASHHSVFTGRMPFLPPNQQHQSAEGGVLLIKWLNTKVSYWLSFWQFLGHPFCEVEKPNLCFTFGFFHYISNLWNVSSTISATVASVCHMGTTI